MNKTWLIVAALALLVLLPVCGLAILFKSRSSETRQVVLPSASSKAPSRVLSTAASRPASAVDLTLSFEAERAPARFYYKPFQPTPDLPKGGDLAPLVAGLNRIDLSDFPDGRHTIYVVADGYAPQWIPVNVKDHAVADQPPVTMYRKRYVIMRWAYNPEGGTELTGPKVKTGRAALSQFGQLPYFGMDWQMWQAGDREGQPRSMSNMFGDHPTLEMHRISRNNGFQEVPEGATFDSLTDAPPDGYEPRSIEAKPGLLLFCHVNGNTPKPPDRGYGKILVEDVTTTRPTGIEIREPAYPVSK